jgi:hypothetical protein
MHSRLRPSLENGDTQARKAYLRAVISSIEVGDERVRIIGEKAALAGAIAGRQTSAKNVSGYIRKWRAKQNETAKRWSCQKKPRITEFTRRGEFVSCSLVLSW